MKGLNHIKTIGFGKSKSCSISLYHFIFSCSFSIFIILWHFLSKKFSDTCILRMIERFTKVTSLDALCQPFNTKIFIASDNRVLLLRTDYQTSEQYSTIFDQNGAYLSSWLSYFTFSKQYLRVESKIIHSALEILKRREQSQSIEKKKKQFDKRMFSFEDDIRKIMQMIERHDGNIVNKLKRIGDTRKIYF